jgi:hypothetical protein
MPKKHLEQVLVDHPKLADGLTAFGDFLKTSYFYPSGSYEKCEDPRVPNAWLSLSKKFEPYIQVSLPPSSTLFPSLLFTTISSPYPKSTA